MTSFGKFVAKAGLGHFPAWLVAAVMVCLSACAGLILHKLLGLMGLGLAGAVLAALAELEALRLLANRRSAAVSEALPQVVEALQSAVMAGMPILDAIEDLAHSGPVATRQVFARCSQMAMAGTPLPSILDWLKTDLAHYQSDQLCELLRFSQSSGGMSLARNLAELAEQIRTDAATFSELQAKQGWVVGIAKLALATPWLVVAMLGMRPENAAIYNSPTGLVLLLTGLCCCLGAFAVIHKFAQLPQPRRVFDS